MKKFVLAMVAVLALSSTSSLAVEQAIGKITSIDGWSGEIHLQTGEVLYYDDFTPFIGFIPGDQVAVGYRTLGDGTMQALGMTRILPSSDDDENGGYVGGGQTTVLY